MTLRWTSRFSVLVAVVLAGCILASPAIAEEPARDISPDLKDQLKATLAQLNLELEPDRVVRDSLLNELNELLYYPLPQPVPTKSATLENWLSPVLTWRKPINGVRANAFFDAPYFLVSLHIQRNATRGPKSTSTDTRWVLANETAIKSQHDPAYAVGSALAHVKWFKSGEPKDATLFVKFTDGWHMVDLLSKRAVLSLPKRQWAGMGQTKNPTNCVQCHELKRHSDFVTIKGINSYDQTEISRAIGLKRLQAQQLSVKDVPAEILTRLRKAGGGEEVCYSDHALDPYGADDRLVAAYRAKCMSAYGDITMVLGSKHAKSGKWVFWDRRQPYLDADLAQPSSTLKN